VTLDRRARPLDAFPAIRSQDAGVAELAVREIYGARRLNLPRGHNSLNVRANHWQSGTLGVSYCDYGGPAQVEFPAAGFFRQQFVMRGGTDIWVDKRRREVTAQNMSVVPPFTPLVIDFPVDFDQMVLRITVDPLMHKLAALIGAMPSRTLEFAAATPVGDAALRLQRLLRFFVDELDTSRAKMPAQVLSEMEQALMVAFLLGNPNNYSSVLEGAARAPASWQVRRAEEYIVANWDRPITIEALARETETSARSLFHHFRRSRGQSPMDFLKEVRLRHAREMFQREGKPVTEVAFACGFGNLGHFARDYRRRFGERPSETLRRRRS